MSDAIEAARERGLDANAEIANGHALKAFPQSGDDQRLSRFGVIARGVAGRLPLADFGDVGGELDDFVRPAFGVQHRVVGAPDPDFRAARSDSAKGVREGFSRAQPLPEPGVLGAAGVLRRDKHAVAPAFDVLQPVTHRRQEIVVRVDDRAVEFEFDDSLRTMNGRHDGLQIRDLLLQRRRLSVFNPEHARAFKPGVRRLVLQRFT